VFIVGCDAPDPTLRQFAAAALGRTSVPMDIVRIDALPLLPNGKLDRLRLLTMVR
jgi:acyl-CoA synthetase (AMP-forming)/AMP-acid ligase II